MRVKFTVGIYMVVLIFASIFLLYPQIDKYMELKDELYIKERLYEEKEAANAQFPEKKQELEELSGKYNRIREVLPPLHKMTEKIVDISSLLTQHGLKEREFSIGETIKTESDGVIFFKVTFTVTAVGSYDGVMAYIADIEGLNNMCTIDTVIFSSENVATSGDINFVLHITVYAAQDDIYESQREEGSYEDYTGNPFYYE